MNTIIEIVAGTITIFLISYGLYSIAKDVFTFLKNRKGGIAPNLRNIPQIPGEGNLIDAQSGIRHRLGERIERIKPTIETQYGRDLIHASIEIYKVISPAAYSPADRSKQATDIAKSLVSQVNEKCFEIDMEKAEKSSNDAIKAFSKLGELGIK